MIHINQSVRVTEPSEVAHARRVVTECAEAQELGETSTGRAALVTMELATNLVKHGDGGTILIGTDESRPNTITITAFDKGRGIANVQAAVRDGYSTAGSSGTGLGAVYRASLAVDLYTFEGKGTVVHCVVGNDTPAQTPVGPRTRLAIAGIALPKAGETENGDAWSAALTDDAVTIGLADGLGHGPVAATASAAAARVFASGGEQALERLLQDTHGALRGTRGAAVGIARIHMSAERCDFIGIGNIAATIVSDDRARKTVSLPGIVGHEMRKLQTFAYAWNASSVVVLQSDGVSASWSADSYPGLMQREPALIAAVLYRDHCRGTDDATIVVAKVA